MARKSFDELWKIAVDRKGEEALTKRMPEVQDAETLAGIWDDRWLAVITQHVFSAGFTWRVIQAKWDGFEQAFEHFDPDYVASLDELAVEALKQDKRIVRNGQKIVATIENAKFVNAISKEHGGFGKWVAEWSEDDPVGLWHVLAKDGARLGGNTGPRSLRSMGKDTFILTPDVTYALTEQGVMTGKPTAKGQQKKAQEAFVAWKKESGRPMAQVSVVLACTVDRPSEEGD